MARQRGALDRRLLDVRPVTAEVLAEVLAAVLAEVLKEHDCSDGRACAACGYRPTRRQPVCRSVAVAQGIRWGRAPRWAGDDPPVVVGEGSGGEQDGLFCADQIRRPGGGSRRGGAWGGGA